MLSADQVLRSEGANAQRGLSSAEATARAQRFGPNKLAAAKAEPRWHAFLRQYRDPMQIVLLAAGIGSLYPLKQLGTGILLILLTLFNAVLGLHQEGKAAAAVAALQKMMIITARVRRDGQLAEIPAGQLVPGDIVAIEAGDIVPADGRLLNAATLEVAESALTGESLPVTKSTDTVAGTGTPLGDRTDMVYMNTNVTRGAGEFVITATGMATEVGHISGLLAEEQIGDPTEGALIVLAAKGGIDAVSTRERYPRIAELPFDAAYKLMATFHKMTGASGKEVIRCFAKGAPDQLLPRAATVVDADNPVPADGESRQRYLAASRACGSWPPRARTSTRRPSSLAPICSRW
jgi:magnesium-transporting ATPase (P-type)